MIVEEIAHHTQISTASVHYILTGLLKKQSVGMLGSPSVYSRTEEQKQECLIIAMELLVHFYREGETFLKCIVAIGEMWTRDFEPELKRQLAEWRHHSSPRLSKCCQVQSRIKQIVIMVYD